MTKHEPNLSIDEQVTTARRAGGVAVLPWRSQLDLKGPDRVRFLDGQCTQHVAGRGLHQGGYGFLLEPKGQVVTDLEFLVLEDRLALEVPAERKDTLTGWLSRFLLLSDAELVDREQETRTLMVVGPRAEAALTADQPLDPEADGAVLEFGGVSVVARRDHTCGPFGWSLRVPSGAVDVVIQATGLQRISEDAVEVMRVESGRPRFGRELDPSVLPLESGQEARAVSYDKGCYCGQEVVARQRYLGKPRKRLVGLVLEGTDAAPGDAVSLDGTQLGVLGSVCRSPALDSVIALAVLRGDDHPPGARRDVTRSDGGTTVVTVAPLPFLT